MGIISISIHFGWLPILAKTKFGWAWSPSILISDHNDWWLQYILYYIYISYIYIYIINQYVLWIWGPLSTTTPGVGLTSKNNTCWNINLSLTRRLHFLPFAHRCSGSNGNSHARPLCPAHLLPGFFFWGGGDHVNITGQIWDAPLNYVSKWPSRVATASFHKGSKAWVGHIDFSATKWWHGFAWSKIMCNFGHRSTPHPF